MIKQNALGRLPPIEDFIPRHIMDIIKGHIGNDRDNRFEQFAFTIYELLTFGTSTNIINVTSNIHKEMLTILINHSKMKHLRFTIMNNPFLLYLTFVKLLKALVTSIPITKFFSDDDKETIIKRAEEIKIMMENGHDVASEKEDVIILLKQIKQAEEKDNYASLNEPIQPRFFIKLINSMLHNLIIEMELIKPFVFVMYNNSKNDEVEFHNLNTIFKFNLDHRILQYIGGLFRNMQAISFSTKPLIFHVADTDIIEDDIYKLIIFMLMAYNQANQQETFLYTADSLINIKEINLSNIEFFLEEIHWRSKINYKQYVNTHRIIILTTDKYNKTSPNVTRILIEKNTMKYKLLGRVYREFVSNTE